MPPNLISLSAELRVAIFCCLGDLDDVLFLSQTCRTFSSTFVVHKKLIQMHIVVR